MTRILTWLTLVGRHGPPVFLVSLMVGLAVPPLASVARPAIGLAAFVFLVTTFVRVDPGSIARLLRAPRHLVEAVLCLTVAPVLLVGAIVGLWPGRLEPGLVLGLAVLAASPPIISSPAVAMMLGIEPTLVVAAILSLTAAAPLLSPLVIALLAGDAVSLDIGVLLERLLGLVGGAALVAWALRHRLGLERVRRFGGAFDGVAVLMYILFAIAAMDGVLFAILRDPMQVLRFLAFAIGLAVAGYGISWLAIPGVPPGERLVLGYGTGQRNMALLIAALGTRTPDTTFLFFALAQFPIFAGPQIIKSLIGRPGTNRRTR